MLGAGSVGWISDADDLVLCSTALQWGVYIHVSLSSEEYFLRGRSLARSQEHNYGEKMNGFIVHQPPCNPFSQLVEISEDSGNSNIAIGEEVKAAMVYFVLFPQSDF